MTPVRVYCEKCHELHLAKEFSDLKAIFSINENPSCEKCENAYRDSIIPPKPNKTINDNFVLKQVWVKAKNALSRSSHIIFIGYSLPEADPLVIKLIESTKGGNKKYYVMDTESKVIDKYLCRFGSDIKPYRDGYSAENLGTIYEEVKEESV